MAEALLQRGHDVSIIDNLSTGRFENVEHLSKRRGPQTGSPSFSFAIEDITDQVVLDRLASQCDVIFHLAAAVGVKLIVDDPVHTIETNVTGTKAVLDTALRYRTKVLIASSSEVYGKGLSIPFSEDDDVVLGPTQSARWSYATSKLAEEFLGLAYHRQMALPVVVFRLFNTVGPRQKGQYGMVMPRFVEQALNGEPLTVYGDGQQSRCFCDVEDAVEAIIGLAESPEAIGQVYNIGSTEEITMLELAGEVLAQVNAGHDDETSQVGDIAHSVKLINYEDAYEAGFEDMRRRVPNISKIEGAIGWRPSVGLAEVISKTIAYFREVRTA